MAREFPVGTIRNWQSGDVIKAHNPIPPYSSGWIPLIHNEELEKAGRECDRVAAQILQHEEPINGELFLDHEIDVFIGEDGSKPYKHGEFKQYNGYYGAGYYSFRNEFSRRFMSERMRLDEMVNNALIEANEDAGGDKDNDKLSKEAKTSIRSSIRKEFRENDAFSIKDTIDLKNIVDQTLVKVKEGENISDYDKKIIYDECLYTVDSLPIDYEKVKVKKAQRDSSVAIIEREFADNWGLRESFKKRATEKFTEYVRKYKEAIRVDSTEEMIEEFGVDLGWPTKQFYEKLLEKSKSLSLAEREDRDQFFKFLVYIRMATKYGKSVEGDWSIAHIPALYNIEMAIDELPQGHFLTNNELTLITNQSYAGGDHGGYAWYDGSDKRINFSASCINTGSTWGVLANPGEFRSVLFHEIGHAVSKKLGRANAYDYKKFVVECGWTYQSKELRMGMTATGGDKDIPRTGSNSTVDLISDYCKKSPEEAFAEYYSFYKTNKQNIDSFLATGNKDFLSKESKITAPEMSEAKTLGNRLSWGKLSLDSETFPKFRDTLRDVSDMGRDIDLSLVSPWQTTTHKDEKNKLDTNFLKNHKRSKEHEPIFVYRDGDKRVVFHGVNDVEKARMNQKLCPSVEVSKELFYSLKSKGMSNIDIVKCLITEKQFDYPKKQIAPQTTLFGLFHRDRFVDKALIARNGNILRAMKQVYDSPQLQKALMSLFGVSDDDTLMKAYLSGYISDDQIEKAWKKQPIGSTTVHKDGTKWRKQSETGNSKQDWVLVTKEKTPAKSENKENKIVKPESDKDVTPTPDELKEHAKNSPETALQSAIKQSPDAEIRETAHQELDRRSKEEDPKYAEEQREKEEKEKIGKNKKGDKVEEISLDDKLKSLTQKYATATADAMNDDYSDRKKTEELSNRRAELSRYTYRIDRIKSKEPNKSLEVAKKSLKLESDEDLQKFLGDGKILGIDFRKISDSLFIINTVTKEAYSSREINKTSKSVHMNEFILDPELDRSKGYGTKIFYGQVQAFKKMGLKKLETLAACSDTYNGYYTWARLGYKMSDPDDVRDLRKIVKESSNKTIKECKNLDQLMSFQEGRDFWKKNGFEFLGVFDLSDNSRSMWVLEKYMEEKKNAERKRK